MGMFNDYKYERELKVSKGYYWVELLNYDTTPSKKGSPMLTIQIRLNIVPGLKIKDFFIKNEFFNINVSRICDCFGVEADDEKLMTWPGAIGVVALKEDGEYMRVSKYVPRVDVDKLIKDGTLPQWEGPMPERQTITSIPRSDAADPNEDSDELPF